MSIFSPFLERVSNDIGIDLGTANTLVHLRGRGVIIQEPSTVALNKKTNQVVAVGTQARDMIGKTPGHIIAVRPVVDGVISDFEVTEEMLRYLINKVEHNRRKLFGPRVVIGVPSGITSVQVRAVRDAALSAGAREVHIIEEPMAAAIGIGLPVREAIGSMIIDVGGGTTDVGIISLGGMVIGKNIRIAGDRFNSDIMSYVRNEFKLLIGERTAEDIKIAVGSADEHVKGERTGTIRGRDLVSGLPKEVVMTDADVRAAIGHSLDELVDAIKEILETTPPEVLSDIVSRGVMIVGGGALLRGLPELLARELHVRVTVAEDPLTAVVRGTAKILEDISSYKEALIKTEDEIRDTQ